MDAAYNDDGNGWGGEDDNFNFWDGGGGDDYW